MPYMLSLSLNKTLLNWAIESKHVKKWVSTISSLQSQLENFPAPHFFYQIPSLASTLLCNSLQIIVINSKTSLFCEHTCVYSCLECHKIWLLLPDSYKFKGIKFDCAIRFKQIGGGKSLCHALLDAVGLSICQVIKNNWHEKEASLF